MQEENSPTFDIRVYVRIIRKRRYLVLSVALGVLSLLTWGSFIWPKTYEASSTVMMDKSALVNPLVPGDTSWHDRQHDEERLLQVQNIFMSRSLIERVVKKLGLNESIKERIQTNIKITTGGVGRRPDQDYFTIAYRGSRSEDRHEFRRYACERIYRVKVPDFNGRK